MPKKFRQPPSSLRSREEGLWSARETAQPLAARMRPRTLDDFVGQVLGCALYYAARRLVGA